MKHLKVLIENFSTASSMILIYVGDMSLSAKSQQMFIDVLAIIQDMSRARRLSWTSLIRKLILVKE